MVTNFRYVEADRIALSGVPLSVDEAEWLYDQGIRSLVSLEPPPPEVVAALRELGIAVHESFVSSFGPDEPDPAVMAKLIAECAEGAAGVLVH